MSNIKVSIWEHKAKAPFPIVLMEWGRDRLVIAVSERNNLSAIVVTLYSILS